MTSTMRDTGTITATVASLEPLPGDIRHVTFASADGAVLPPFDAGSHIVVHCGDNRNAYTLTNDGRSPSTYEISVKHQPDGRGGSRWIHRLAVGDHVTLTRPRSLFRVDSTAKHLVLIAGGIGVTPVLAHLRDAVRWGRSVRVIYAHRPGASAHTPELAALCREAGAAFLEVSGAARTREALLDVLAGSPIGTHAYICGPPGMVADFRTRASDFNWPSSRVHSEAFTAPSVEGGDPFTVVDASTGTEIPVGAEDSALESLEAAGYTVPNMCRQGVCGECRLTVAAQSAPPPDTIEHRDMVLTAEERMAGTSFLPCVSRCSGQRLEVELP